MPVRVASTLAAVLLGLAGLVGGCNEGAGLGVAEGRYRLVVEGALTDTLTGPATVRAHQNGRVGIELGRRDGPGLSMEVVPGRRTDAGALQPGRYDVVTASLLDGPTADSLSGVLAFLAVADLQFVAAQGHLSVTEAREGAVAGRVTLEMVEQRDAVPGDQTVQVTGVLRAMRP